MKICVVCSSLEHPIYPRLQEWCRQGGSSHKISLVQRAKEIGEGDILFLISCSELIKSEVRSRFKASLVVHASPLPKGRGWSPHLWQVLEGARSIPVSLIEADDPVDTGAIWAQERFELEGHEFSDEINEKLFAATFRLMDLAISRWGKVQPRPQGSEPSTYYRKRTPEDSRLDPEKTIAEQFDLLRIADPRRFPNFFDFRGHRYVVTVRKAPLT